MKLGILALPMLGVALLPATPSLLLALALFLLTLLVQDSPQRRGWIRFALSTILLGSLIYGLTLSLEPLVRAGSLRLSPSGALVGLQDMVRLVGFLSVGMMAARWIRSRDLLPLVTRRAVPFYVAGGIVRLVPAVREDAHRILSSQLARGHQLRGAWHRPRAFLAILVPLFVSTLRRAREQAIALQVAGVAPSAKRKV